MRRTRALQQVFCLCSSLALVASVVAGGTTAAWATQFHGYSVVTESAWSTALTGLQTSRLDQYVFNQASDGCTSWYAGTPVYQTEWIAITPDAQNWLELGTGHQCNDVVQYWFAGFGYLGVWFPLVQRQPVTNGTSHAFTISKSGGTYSFIVDLTTIATQPSSTGSYLQAGLESYSSSAILGSYANYNLKWGVGPTWGAWGISESYFVTGANMCGHLYAPTWWQVAEHQPC